MAFAMSVSSTIHNAPRRQTAPGHREQRGAELSAPAAPCKKHLGFPIQFGIEPHSLKGSMLGRYLATAKAYKDTNALTCAILTRNVHS